jgi:Leucine-rich repeat (LRR) protein
MIYNIKYILGASICCPLLKQSAEHQEQDYKRLNISNLGQRSMEPERVPALLEALFICYKTEILDRATKAALRLCKKHFKNLVDASTFSSNLSDVLNALLNTEWHGLEKLYIMDHGNFGPSPLTELPSALFIKFSRLETLKISHCRYLEALPVEIGDLQHLKTLKVNYCPSLETLPSSLGQLTTLEKITLKDCSLTAEGIAPLRQVTGLTSVYLSNYTKTVNFPDFIWNSTSMKELMLCSPSIDTVPDALGNLTNLESLTIRLDRLIELPESIGNLNALKEITFVNCRELTALPESFDDLLWRKAQETRESCATFLVCPKLEFSPKMKQVRNFI